MSRKWPAARLSCGGETPITRRLTADQGFDPVDGARPLRRFVARDVATRSGPALLAGDVEEGAVILVDAPDGEITISYKNPG